MDETWTGTRAFPATAWSTILRGKVTDPAVRRQALEKLFARYWRPVYCSLRFGWNRSSEDAKDHVQGFFMNLLERDFLQDVDPAKGRFRAFLKVALKHYMLNEKRDAKRQKRGGAFKTFTLDGFEEVTAEPGDPDTVFDNAWYRTVLRNAIDELREKLASAGKEAYFRVFELHDLVSKRPSYDALAQQVGITETDVRNYLHYARKVLRRIVVHHVSQYALDEKDAREELRWILK